MEWHKWIRSSADNISIYTARGNPSKLTSIECILIRRPRVVGNLYTGLILGSIVVDIEIGAFVESMVHRLRHGFCKIGMDIGKAARSSGLTASSVSSSGLIYSHGQHALFA